MNRVLIIDHNNFFLRYWIISGNISSNGDQIGGVVGSLKGLQKTVRDIRPDKIVICFDGAGGSRRRKIHNKNYKEGRKPPKMNWENPFLSDQDKEDNKMWQLKKVIEYYQCMPVHLLNFDDFEADDIISCVCQEDFFKGWQKVILSSDKDFIQLLNKETVLYRPIQNEVLNTKKVLEKYGINVNNFVLARAICGDDSDNLKGVKGAGLSTVAKRFPFLSEEKEYNIDSIISHCSRMITEEKSKVKVYQEIINNKKIIKENYDLMQLIVPSITYHVKEQIKNNISNDNLMWNKTKFYGMIMQDGISNTDWTTLVQCFNRYKRGNK
jgi:5'-3' exonuclease